MLGIYTKKIPEWLFFQSLDDSGEIYGHHNGDDSHNNSIDEHGNKPALLGKIGFYVRVY